MTHFSKTILPRRFWAAMAGLALLTACGADGEPIRPGVDVSGDAQIGVAGSVSN